MSYIQSSMDRFVLRSSGSNGSSTPQHGGGDPQQSKARHQQPANSSSGFFSESLQPTTTSSLSCSSDFINAWPSAAASSSHHHHQQQRHHPLSKYHSVSNLQTIGGGAQQAALHRHNSAALKRSHSVAANLGSSTAYSASHPLAASDSKRPAKRPANDQLPTTSPHAQQVIITGSVRQTIDWHRRLPQLNALCEVYARVVRVVAPSASSASPLHCVLLLSDAGQRRSPSTPVLPAHYYAIDFALPAAVLRCGAAVRCVGRFTAAPGGRFQVYKCRCVDGQLVEAEQPNVGGGCGDVVVVGGALVTRLTALSNHGLRDAKTTTTK